MMSLFDEEQIMKTYLKDRERKMAEELTGKVTRKVTRETEKDTERKIAKRMIEKGKTSLEESADYVPTLGIEEN